MLHLLVFYAYINEMHGSRNKIPSKNLVRQRCTEVFNSGFKGLKPGILAPPIRQSGSGVQLIKNRLTLRQYCKAEFKQNS
jgi:hypothetical protein